MATIQSRISGGHKYWYIVESRRVNGKPRPIPLAYLGKAGDLLKRIQKGIGENVKYKSYSHGAIAALLRVVEDLSIIDIINKHVPEKRHTKQIRDGLTVGSTLTLRAIEKVCHPCSNREFSKWAKSTTLEYLLRISCANLDSQHFWDQMNELPINAIPKIEEEIVQRVIENEKILLDTLLLDATNFFTFIDTANTRCSLPQRGKNKQGRKNLRQVGVLLVASRKDIIPLFHETYTGNKADSKLFAETIKKITDRVCAIATDLEDLTLIFDRGNNSKSNLSKQLLKMHYVGALSPSQHKDLMDKAAKYFTQQTEKNKGNKICYRVKQELWGETRSIIVYKSEELYNGQLRGIEKDLTKRFKKLEELNTRFSNPRCKKLTRKQILKKIEDIVKGQFVQEIISWNLPRKSKHFKIEYGVDDNKLKELERTRLGYRILITDRHDWSNEEIIAAYHGQSKVEYAFRNIKNPYHGAIRPQFHWTDQKIRVHVFTCILGFLLESIVYRRAQMHGYEKTNYDNLFDRLKNIRLATLIEKTGKPGRMKAVYELEETEQEDEVLLDALHIRDMHINRPKLKGLVVYN